MRKNATPYMKTCAKRPTRRNMSKSAKMCPSKNVPQFTKPNMRPNMKISVVRSTSNNVTHPTSKNAIQSTVFLLTY